MSYGDRRSKFSPNIDPTVPPIGAIQMVVLTSIGAEGWEGHRPHWMDFALKK